MTLPSLVGLADVKDMVVRRAVAKMANGRLNDLDRMLCVMQPGAAKRRV